MAVNASGVKKDSPAKPAGKEEAPPAEGAEGEAAAAPASGKNRFSRKKIIIIASAAVLLLAAIIGGLYFGGFIGGHAKEELSAEELARVAGEAELAGGIFLDVPDITVNLASTGKQAHFLKMSISVEVSSELEKTELQKQLPHVVDQFQVYLRELRMEDLSGSAGIYRLREELLERVKAVSGGVPVKDVLFREILVQ